MKCPGFERIIDYLDGSLTTQDVERVEVHLSAGCRSCLETRDWYRNVRQAAANDDTIEPPAWVLKRAVRIFEAKRRPSLSERVGQAVASLVFDSLARPALSGVRSTETTNRQLLYRASDYSIDLQIAPSGTGADLIGQVLREGETAFESVANLHLRLMGEHTYSATTDAMGEFVIRGIKQGIYDLHIELGPGGVIIPGLQLSQS
jgi:hypothetical protein